MKYLIQNWSEFNIVDRAWFLIGAWLVLLLITMIFRRIYKDLLAKSKN